MKPVKQNATRISAPDHLRVGEYCKEFGGSLVGLMRGAPGLPDYYLFAANGPDAKKIKFGPHDVDVSGATSNTDGAANTHALCAHKQIHPAAEWAQGLSLDGFRDFYLPACHELRLCYLSVPQLFDKTAWYWSSTQHPGYSDCAYFQTFGNGYQGSSRKSYEGRARAVRRLLIIR